MNAIKTLTLTIAMLTVLAAMGGAHAQQRSQPDAGATMGQSTMSHGGMMGARSGRPSLCKMMTQHVEGRLAFLKAELNITAEQESLWNDYAAAVRDNAKTMAARCATLMGQASASAQKLPDRLDAQEQFMAARLDALRATSKTLKTLYASLTDAQKQTADQLIRSSTGMI
jgi:hypothetical protein